MGEFVRLEMSDGIGTIRLERPPMNALNTQVQEELRAAAGTAAEDPQVRAVVVYGGERVFAAGADITEFPTTSYAQMAVRAAALSGAFDAVARIPKPVVAAVTGYALGGGCELALACDWRVVADDARLGQPEIRLGLIPGAGGTQRLARLIGPARAKDLIFSGRMVRADEALRIGLADRVVPPDQVYAAAVELVRPYTGVRLWPCAPRSWPSTAAWTWIWPLAWPGRASSSPGCSPPTTCARVRPRSSTSVNRGSPAGERRAGRRPPSR